MVETDSLLACAFVGEEAICRDIAQQIVGKPLKIPSDGPIWITDTVVRRAWVVP